MRMPQKPIISFFSPTLGFEFDVGKYSSLRWRRKYFEPGEFEIHTSAGIFNKVYRGQLLLRPDRKEAGVIQGIDISDSGLVITGRFLSIFLQDAAIRSIYNFNTTNEAAMRQLVQEQYNRVKRPLPISLGELHGFADKIQTQVSLKNLLTVVEAMGRAANLGFIVYPEVSTRRLVFDVYRGTNHSVLQTENTRVVFSNRYKNITGPEYKEDDSLYKNYAIVAGEGEGTARVIVDVDRTGGEPPRELLVDARDLSRGEQTEAAYRAALAQRGAEKLDENALTQSFETGIKSTSQFTYLQDWDLGDIVTAEQTDWGLQTDQRVTEVEEVYENNGFSATPTLGTPLPETFKLEESIG